MMEERAQADSCAKTEAACCLLLLALMSEEVFRALIK